MLKFTEISTDFFDSFLDALQCGSDLPKPEVKFEPLFENGGPLVLIELAVQQKRADYGLLHLHYQLCVVLHMITKFNVKHSKPVNNLFEPSLAGLFFTGNYTIFFIINLCKLIQKLITAIYETKKKHLFIKKFFL